MISWCDQEVSPRLRHVPIHLALRFGLLADGGWTAVVAIDVAVTEIAILRMALVNPVCRAGSCGLIAASGIGPGNAVARDIRLAEMLIAARAHPDPAALTASNVKLKTLLAA